MSLLLHPREREGRASVSLELVLLAPLLLALMLLIIAFGRYTHVKGYVDQAARDAARSATAARDGDAAQTAVTRTIEANLSDAPPSCLDSATHTVTTSNGNEFVASNPYSPVQNGGLNVLTVTVSCRIGVSDLAFIGFDQNITLTSTFSSPMPAIYGTY